jgi:hypothetical protein
MSILMDVMYKSIDMGESIKPTMEFTQATVKQMQKVVQWVRDHPKHLEDRGLATADAATIIVRVLADPELVMEYEHTIGCQYVYKSGPEKGSACGKTLTDDQMTDRCTFHDNPIFLDEFRKSFNSTLTTALTKVLQETEKSGVKSQKVLSMEEGKPIGSSDAIKTVCGGSLEKKPALIPYIDEILYLEENLTLIPYIDNENLYQVSGTTIIVRRGVYSNEHFCEAIGSIRNTPDYNKIVPLAECEIAICEKYDITH